MKRDFIWGLSTLLVCAAMTFGAHAVLSLVNNQRQAINESRPSFAGTLVTQRGLTGRKLLQLPAGACYFLQFPMNIVTSEELVDDLVGDPTTTADDLLAYDEPVESPWYVRKNNPNQLSTFNCAAYAVGDSVGLKRCDWLDTSAQVEYNGVNPVKVVLDSHYEQQKTLSTSRLNWKELDFTDDLQADDIIAFVDTTKALEFVHLGRVQEVGGRKVLVSKLGDGPIVQGTIEQTARRYPRMFNQVRIYRRKKATA